MEIASMIISLAVAVGALIWGIINDTKNRNLGKRIAVLQGKIEKGNYVSRVVFDQVFLQFQKLSVSLFENYNNAAARLFPIIERVICSQASTQEKIDKMKEYWEKSKEDLNSLIRLIQTNRFILTSEMIQLLEQFEGTMKGLINSYEEKIIDLINEDSEKLITAIDEQKLQKKAVETQTLYNSIMDCFKKHLESLQIID